MKTSFFVTVTRSNLLVNAGSSPVDETKTYRFLNEMKLKKQEIKTLKMGVRK